MLEPSNYLLYVIMLILSIIVLMLSVLVLLLFLNFDYQQWVKLMRDYNDRFIKMSAIPIELSLGNNKNDEKIQMINETYKADDEKDDLNLLVGDDDEIDTSTKVKRKRKKKVVTARICNLKYPLVSTNVEGITSHNPETKSPQLKIIEAIELEPLNINEIEEDLEKLQKYHGPDKEIGRLTFTMQYNDESQELRLNNLNGEGFRKKDSQTILNPFITIYIWPDNQWSIKTKTIKRSNTPKWQECIVIENFDKQQMASKALHFKIFSWQNLKPNDVIGHVLFPLKVFDFENDVKPIVITKNLQPTLKVNKGSIKIYLKYTEMNVMEVTIVKAKTIYPTGFISDQCQFFAKIQVNNHGSSNIAHFRTSLICGTFCPQWFQKFEFPVPDEHRNMNINISVREEGFSKDGKLFGYCEMSLKSKETDRIHLTTALQNPERVICRWHQLISDL